MGSCCSSEEPPSGRPAAIGPGDIARAEAAKKASSIWSLGLSLLLTGNIMVVGLAISSAEAAANITLFIHIVLLSSLVIIFDLIGWPLAKSALKALRARQVTFELFFSIGIAAATLASLVSMFGGGGPVYFEVAAVLLVIHAVGRRVGDFRRRQGLAAARAWAPETKTARRRNEDGRLASVPLDRVAVGEIVVVGPGEMIGVDGVVTAGTALVRESEITGESFAAARRPGDRVYAGTHSLDGVLDIRVTGCPGARLIDEIVASVEEAWQRPSKWQEQAEEVVRWFVPVVLAITVATFAGWTIAEGWTVGLFHALAVLLVACPCALGFAVPLTVWATMGKWARRGLIPRHGQCVETLSRVDTVVFDKTGTLTESAPMLIDFVVAEQACVDEVGLRQMIVAVEEAIDHPVARALTGLKEKLPHSCCRSPVEIKWVEVLPGRGVAAEAYLGDVSFALEMVGVELIADGGDSQELIEELRRRIHGPPRCRQIVVFVDGRPVALAAIDEAVRNHVASGIALLQEMKIEVGLMTGDHRSRARRLNVDWWRAEMTPAQKAQAVERLREEGKTVLFVGDGVNDAAAMATSDVAIAVAGGAELAGEIGDLQWCGTDLRAIGRVIATARQAFDTVRFNLRFAIFYNIAGVAIAAVGLLHPVIAALLMMTSSLFVTWKTTISVERACEQAWPPDEEASADRLFFVARSPQFPQ